MSVVKLVTQNFRNLTTFKLYNFHPELNFFVGDNGSGKSSLLEAVYFFLVMVNHSALIKLSTLLSYDKDDFVVSIKR